MRIDCYNACECEVSSVEYGDTFYYNGRLCMRCRLGEGITSQAECTNCVYIIYLDVGEVMAVEYDTIVILANTKVVADTKEV